MTNSAARNIHQGRNIKRFREMLGIKQDALAHELGEDWSQKKISLLEQKESIEENILKQVAEILHIPVEAIQNFDEEQAVNIIANTVTTVNDNATGQLFQINPTINTAEKWLEALEEIKRLNEEIIRLKDEQIEMLKDMIKNK
ncbi:helix-turn-helix domain-containing protein [Echinicola marina]|uniref:helix-turn-helix transcriptional regulator n=1 Tax=Echinicola marina TaxID=2859768 RepID=UPI001CF705FE|nr:helix-turn-helix transcriptional regulator [Echinicola marina]UCS93864.1 helix-turn-helix domain-containing protein [Echinicola marina]